MPDELLLKQLTDVIAESLKIPREKITPTARFHEDLGIDSLDQGLLIMSIESYFQLPIDDEELQEILAVQDMVLLLEKKLHRQSLLGQNK